MENVFIGIVKVKIIYIHTTVMKTLYSLDFFMKITVGIERVQKTFCNPSPFINLLDESDITLCNPITLDLKP